MANTQRPGEMNYETGTVAINWYDMLCAINETVWMQAFLIIILLLILISYTRKIKLLLEKKFTNKEDDMLTSDCTEVKNLTSSV